MACRRFIASLSRYLNEFNRYRKLSFIYVVKGDFYFILFELIETALMKAVMTGRMDLVKSLISEDLKLNLDLRTSDGSTALILAVKRGDLDMAITLIEAGANLDIHTDDGCNALIKSCNFGYERVVKALIEHGANVNEFSKNGNTGTSMISLYFLDYNKNHIISFRRSLVGLMKACEKGYIGIVEALCKANAKIEIHSNDGCCAFIRSANYGHEECVRLLIEYGANINIVSLGGRNTALIKACEKGYTNIARMLIEKNCTLDHANKAEETAIMIATKYGRDDICNMIREKQREIIRNCGISSSESCLLRAVKEGDEVTACCLIRNGCVLVCHYPDGCCPMIKSSNLGYDNIALDLIKYGADVNATSNNGNTALMKACERGNVTIAKALLEARAKIELHNKEGCCAFIRASNNGHEEIIRLLISFGANINVRSKNGNTGLIKASQNGFIGIVNILLTRGADVEIANNAGLTAYDLAIKSGHTIIAKKIREKLQTLQSGYNVVSSQRSLRQGHSNASQLTSKMLQSHVKLQGNSSQASVAHGSPRSKNKKSSASLAGSGNRSNSSLRPDSAASEKKNELLRNGSGASTQGVGLHRDESVSSVHGMQRNESKSSVQGMHRNESTSSVNQNGFSRQDSENSISGGGKSSILRQNSSSSVTTGKRQNKSMIRIDSSSSVVSVALGKGGKQKASTANFGQEILEEEDEQLDKLLLYAILGENEAEAIDLIMRGANVDVTFPDGCSPLIKSANYGYESVVACLIENGVFVNKVKL